MYYRNKTREFNIGNKKIGGKNPILIQTMSNIKTSNIEENIKLIHDLEKLGCDMIRFSTYDENDCLALKELKSHSSMPIIADIHFNPNYALLSLESGVDKIRLNPGNISSKKLDEIISKLNEKEASLRIGVNSGSLGKYNELGINKEEKFLNALNEMLSYFQERKFEKIVLAAKDSSPLLTDKLYDLLADNYDYPLHVGVTESGFGINGAIKSCVGLVPILTKGIGNTIRISLSDDPRDEIIACKTLLSNLGLKDNVANLISCPTCGRTQVDMFDIVKKVQNKLNYVNKNITVAVMGCPVNGPGEAKNADIGIAGGINEFILFKKGIAIGKYSQDEALLKLFELIDEI